MTVGKSAKSDQRMPQDKANEMARREQSTGLPGAGGPQDSELIESAVAAIGAPVKGAAEQREEIERAKAQGRQMDVDEVAGVSGRAAGRDAPVNPGRSADELEQDYHDRRPGAASARQAHPDAAPTPKQRLDEDGSLN